MNDDLAFFHQATIALCGSLDIDKAVKQCAAHLRHFLPLDGLILGTYDQEQGAVRLLSLTSTCPVNSWEAPVYLSPTARQWLESIRNGIFLYPDSGFNPVVHEVDSMLGINPSSVIVMHLNLDEENLGVVSAFTREGSVFTAEHVRLMNMLHDPFAAAMANTIKHREILRLKDLLADDNSYLKRELRSITGDEIVGTRYGLRNVMELVRQVAPINSNVLLTGETGVGKELIADAIHYSSTRREEPLIKVNCGSFVDSLLDSELFGHEKGAFTGAIRRKRGRFERAHRGTLFLDEVGELPLGAQVRLLRVLQDGIIERVGGTEGLEVDVRIICATHRNLEEMVREGRFREDLLFRLNVFPIHIPPLRQRKSDIPALVHHFIDRKLKALNLSRHPTLTAETMEQLASYHWPGNVRELENIVERALIRHKHLGEEHPLAFDALRADRNEAASWICEGTVCSPPLTLDEAMRQHITEVLRSTGGRIQGKDGAAAILNVHPNTLRSRMRRLGVSYGRKCG